MKLDRNTKYYFRDGVYSKNRVVVPPMASQTADLSGFVTEKTIQHYKNLSESGAGIVFVEYSYIHQSGKGEINQLAVDDDNKIKGLKKISKVIKSNGTLAGFQIVHVGGKSSSQLVGGNLLGASPISVPIKGHEFEIPKEMNQGEINELINWYVGAAKRVGKAGFDIVELHAAHGYGLNQWLSPITNKRTDDYGGGITSRAKLLFEIVKKIRKEVPDLLLAIRLPAEDHFEDGLCPEEMKWVTRKLEEFGVDLIDVSSGIGGWRRPKGLRGQGYLVADATTIKHTTKLPVIGVGGIVKGQFIDQILKENKIDFAAVGRAILENPIDWKVQHMENNL